MSGASQQRQRPASDDGEESSGNHLPQVSRHRSLLTGATVAAAPSAESSKDRQSRQHRRRSGAVIGANLSATKFDIIHLAAERLGFAVSPDEDFATPFLIWSDLGVPPERISELRPHQRINHFPGMSEISRKDHLSHNMARLARVLPQEYNFAPRTWCLPSEYSSFLQHAREIRKAGKLRSFIYKPANGAMGHGIRIYKNGEQVPCGGVSSGGINGGVETAGPAIVQEYIAKPLLIDGFKCDLRIYVLVTSCDPLRVYFYNDGLLRLSTEKYADPQKCDSDTLYMHLTNYSINKRSENYAKGDDDSTGSKRSIRFLNEYLQKRDYDVPLMWRNIIDLLVKTLLAALPHLLQNYRMCRPASPPGSDSVCFEILGFDVLLDHKLKPWLLEVNRSPSFGAEQPIDRRVKLGVLDEALRLLNIRASDRARHANAQKAQSQRRLMRGRSNGAEHQQHNQQQLQQQQRERELARRREELLAQLVRFRREADREEHEIRTCRRFRRIFPGENRVSQERYVRLLLTVFSALTSGRGVGGSGGGGTLKELEVQYSCERPRQEELLEQLTQCDEQLQQQQLVSETAGKQQSERRHQGQRRPWEKQRAPAQSRSRFVALSADEAFGDSVDDEDFEDEDDTEESDEKEEANQREDEDGRQDAEGAEEASGRLPAVSATPTMTTTTTMTTPRRRHTIVATSAERSRSVQTDRGGGIAAGDQQDVEQLNRRMLDQLNELCIRFPGKSAQQAEQVLAGLRQNWRQNKALVAGYWLGKLDFDKRRKVIDIVRQNVRASLARCWRGGDIEESLLCRLFDRVFARLLSSNGQGLWATFGNFASWETAILRLRVPPSLSEIACCRRVVQLCQDCLLTVFLFSGQSSTASSSSYTVAASMAADSAVGLKRERPSLSIGSTPRASLR